MLVLGVVADPWFAVLVVPALTLVESNPPVPLRRSAQLDVETGLHSTVHWQHQAAERLARAAPADYARPWRRCRWTLEGWTAHR